jgi:hypothetical protein
MNSGLTDDAARERRHRVRGLVHGLKLCVAVLDSSLTTEEAVQFLSDIESAADSLDQLMAEIEEGDN